MARKRIRRGLGEPTVAWRSAPGQKSKFADGPRQIAKIGRCTLETYEYCSNKRGSCPTGEFTYVVVKRGVVKAAGPHQAAKSGQEIPMHSSIEAAQRAAVRRVHYDPKLKCH